MVPGGQVGEVWQERRQKRSFGGKLAKWSFIVFNLWMVAEVINIATVADRLRRENSGNGFAALGVNIAESHAFNQTLMLWIAGFVVLGGLTLATRGRKEMVKVSG